MLPRYVEVALPTVLHSRDPDDLEGRMVLRIEQLPLQSLQTAAEHVGLGGIQLRSQTLEPLLLGGIQINLRGLPYTFCLAFFVFMIRVPEPLKRDQVQC